MWWAAPSLQPVEPLTVVRIDASAGLITAHARLCAKLIIPPGAGIGSHEHATEDEVYIVTRGSGLLDDGLGERPIAAGDAIQLDGSVSSDALAGALSYHWSLLHTPPAHPSWPSQGSSPSRTPFPHVATWISDP